jgi:hypothetical protein
MALTCRVAGSGENDGTLEKARQMAAHASTRTTQPYDRREDKVTLDEVVKINIRG